MKSDYTIIEPNSTSDFEKYYNLRWLTLRKEWFQDIGTEQDHTDRNSIHRMILDSNYKAVAVGRLHFNSNKESQIRYMGVHPMHRRCNLGTRLLNELEKISLDSKRNNIILHAREVAIKFYLANGYLLGPKSHILFNSIQHYLMTKTLYSN
tara:strand:+ start:65 stop:517 length:453 start_codon:yes stop_codon:yes gene_type:complete